MFLHPYSWDREHKGCEEIRCGGRHRVEGTERSEGGGRREGRWRGEGGRREERGREGRGKWLKEREGDKGGARG